MEENKQKIALLLAYDYARNLYNTMGQESIRVGYRSKDFVVTLKEEQRAFLIAKILEIRLGYSPEENEEAFEGVIREDATMIQQGMLKKLKSFC